MVVTLRGSLFGGHPKGVTLLGVRLVGARDGGHSLGVILFLGGAAP